MRNPLRQLPSFRRLVRPALAAAALGASIGGFACGPRSGTDVGNGATASVDLHAYKKAPAAKAQSLSLASGARVDGAWMSLAALRLLPGASCGPATDAPVHVPGPFVADLLGDGVLGGAASFALAPGVFCGMRAEFAPLSAASLPAGAPAELGDASVAVWGARADGVPFLVRSNMSDPMDLRALGAAFAVAAGSNPYWLAYDVEPWIGALGLETLSGATLLVDATTNADRLAPFELAVKTSARLFRDANQDGQFTDDDHAEEDELAEGQDDGGEGGTDDTGVGGDDSGAGGDGG